METGLKINPETLREYRKRLADQFKEKPASLNRKLSSLRQFTKWAGDEGYLVKTPQSRSPRHLGKVIVLMIVILIILGLSRFITFSKLPVLKVTEPQTIIAGSSSWIIRFQGKLSSTNGQPIQESAKVVFKLYKEEKGGPPLWTSKTWPLEPNPQGKFVAPVGDTTRGDYELPSNYFFQEKELFLGVEVNGREVPERMQVSTADAAANSYLLQNYPPNLEAGPLTIPVINEDGALVLAAQNSSIKAVSGTLGISADSLSLITPDASDGSITLNPDGKGVVNLLFEGKAPIGGDGFLNAKNANQTSGALIYGEVANNATGYRLIELVSGSTPTTRFSVDGSGNTFVAGQLKAQSGQLTNDLNLVSGNLKTGGVTRLTNAGRLSSISGYYQNSGEFRIDQGAPDLAKITKSGVTASADSLTITMDETNHSASNYDTLVLNRQGGGPTAYALYLATGNALFEGTLEVKKGLTANENLDVRGDTTLGDATTDKVTFNAQIASSLIPTTDSTYDLGSSTRYWNNIYVNNLYGGGSGTLGFWQRASGALSPTHITDDLLLGATATSSALIKFPGVSGGNSWINTGNLGIGTTNPGSKLQVAGDITPEATGTRSLGSSSLIWNNVYANNIIAPPSGTQGYWQRNSQAVSPTNITDDLLIGGIASSSANFQIFGTGTYAGTASSSGSLTFNDTAGTNPSINVFNSNRLDIKTSVGGDGGLGAVMSVLNNGKVGIGTTSPSKTLTVSLSDSNIYSSTSFFSQSAIINTNTTNNTDAGLSFRTVDAGGTEVLGAGIGSVFTSHTAGAVSGNLVFVTKNAGTATEKMRITEGGNVGIGTTNPLATLAVGANSAQSGIIAIPNNVYITARNVDNNADINMLEMNAYNQITMHGTALKIDSSSNIWRGADDTGALTLLGGNTWSTAPTITLYGGSHATYPSGIDLGTSNGSGTIVNRLRISGNAATANVSFSNSNVGIGTTAPGYNLHIASTADAAIYLEADTDNITETDNPFLKMSQDGNTKFAILGETGGAGVDPENNAYTGTLDNAVLLGTGGAGPGALQFGTSTSVRMTIGTGGNIGIGTTSPLTALDITGSASESANFSMRGSGTAHTFNILDNGTLNFTTSVGGDAVTNSTLFIKNGGATTPGNVGIGTTAPGQLLDIAGNVNLSGGNRTVYFTTNSQLYSKDSSGARGTESRIIARDQSTNRAGIQSLRNNATGNWVGHSLEMVTMYNDALTVGQGTGMRFMVAPGADENASFPLAKVYGVIVNTNGEGRLDFQLNKGGTGSTDWEPATMATIATLTKQQMIVNGSGDRGELVLKGNNASNALDYTLLSTRTDLADFVVSVYDDSAATWHEFLNFDYLNDYLQFPVATTIGAGGDPRTALNLKHATSPTLTLERTDTTVTAGEVLGQMDFYSNDSSTNLAGVVGRMNVVAVTAFSGTSSPPGANTAITFSPNTGNAGTLTEAMRIDYTGSVGIGTTSPTSLLHLVGSQPAAVGTTPGTAATDALTITGGIGGNTTIATTGVGGIGADLVLTGGTGGTAASALTASTGGKGGGFVLTGGIGGAAAVVGAGTNIGGAGADLELIGGTGGAASGGASNTGGTGGDLYLVGGAAGTGGSPAVGDVLLGITSGGTARGNVGIGTTAPGDTLHVKGGLCVQNTTACPASSAGQINYDTGASLFDIAEEYKISEPVEAAEVVVASRSLAESVKKSSTPYENSLLGIVSTSPNIVLSSGMSSLGGRPGPDKPDTAVIALAGRVPIKVSTENGPIAIGDPLTSSSTPGVAMRATKAGQVVGKALEAFSCSTSEVTGTGSSDGECQGKTMVFVNVGWYDPDVYLANSGELVISTLDNQSSSNQPQKSSFYTLSSTINGLITRVGAFSDAAVAHLKAGLIQTQDLIANNITTNNLTINNKLVSPVIETQQLTAKESRFGQLMVQNEQGETVASIDNAGNATFSGQLSSQRILLDDKGVSLITAGDASIAGTLYADEIVTRKGTFGELMTASVSAGTIAQADLGEIEKRLAELESSNPPAGKASQPTPTPTPDLSPPEATDSALLADVPNWQLTDPTGDLKITSDVRITGKTNLAQTIIAGPLSQDGSLIIDQGNSINVTTGTLYLQNLGFGGVDILAGKIVVDVNGNVQIAGNLAVGGNLSAATLHLGGVPSATSEVTGTGSSDGGNGFGKLLKIQNPLGETVASIDASGSAQFTQVNTKQLMIASDYSATQSGVLAQIQTNATSGIGIFPAGQTEFTVFNQKVNDNTLIYITPVSNTQNKVLYIKTKKAGEFFKVAIDTPINQDIQFNWWIIN